MRQRQSLQRLLSGATLFFLALGCSDASQPVSAQASVHGPGRFKVDIWADNWFALYLGETKILEDSVPITRERSFNAETSTFDAAAPVELNLIARDYIENDTGLEYIGKPNQQMGDGGVIFQVTDMKTGKILAVSDASVRCIPIHIAPLNPECEKSPNPSETCQSRILPEPQGWKSAGFDSSAWTAATVYSVAQVKPKDGYNKVRWDRSAKLIWTSDLRADNTLLCKLQLKAP